VKKLVGLNIFQAAVFLLYISMGFVRDAAPRYSSRASSATPTRSRAS